MYLLLGTSSAPTDRWCNQWRRETIE